MEPTRKCKKCGETFPLTSQHFHSAGRGEALQYSCKSCRRKLAINQYAQSEDARERKNLHRKNVVASLRRETFEKYGGEQPACICCGEKTIEFLTLDHVNSDGNLHRKEMGIGGDRIYRWAKKHDYPLSLQILCRNCNWAKHAYGVCPHQTKAS